MVSSGKRGEGRGQGQYRNRGLKVQIIMYKISYKDVLYSPAGFCTENNSFFRPMVHNKGVATAWLCLGRGGADTSGPASISASGHSLMRGGQALWSRMLTSPLSSSLLAGCRSPCFEAWWKHRWELALQPCYLF